MRVNGLLCDWGRPAPEPEPRWSLAPQSHRLERGPPSLSARTALRSGPGNVDYHWPTQRLSQARGEKSGTADLGPLPLTKAHVCTTCSFRKELNESIRKAFPPVTTAICSGCSGATYAAFVKVKLLSADWLLGDRLRLASPSLLPVCGLQRV